MAPRLQERIVSEVTEVLDRYIAVARASPG